MKEAEKGPAAASGEDGKISYRRFQVRDLTFPKLRDLLLPLGTILAEDPENQVYVVSVRGGVPEQNPAQVALTLKDTELTVAISAREGLTDRKAADDVLQTLTGALSEYLAPRVETRMERKDSAELQPRTGVSPQALDGSEPKAAKQSGKKRRKHVVPVLLVLLALGAVLFFVMAQLGNQAEKEYEEYLGALEEYNASAERLNGLLERIAPFDVLTRTDPIPVKEPEWEDAGDAGGDLSALEEATEVLSTDQQAVELKYGEPCQAASDGLTDSYNALAAAFNDLLETTSVDFLEDVPQKAEPEESMTWDVTAEDFSEDTLVEKLSALHESITDLAGSYLAVQQITAPDGEWVLERLSTVEDIQAPMAVTEGNDPNGLLGKDGGYSACIYFMLQQATPSTVEGKDAVEKGTDGGGAVEVYPTLEAARNRCEYLSQFDNTLLYSGSYAIVGTMVVRTSYRLSNQEQIDMTDVIVRALTQVEQN